MSTLYPAHFLLDNLSHTACALKISRNSPCRLCSCPGLRPPPGTELQLDTDESGSSTGLVQYADDDDKDERYLDTCACGHDVPAHDADEARLGRDEFVRRTRVAVRMDELRSVSVNVYFHCYHACIIKCFLPSSRASNATHIVAFS